MTISVVTRLQDNGDGGYTMYVYNNEEELLADHPSAQVWEERDGKWGKYPKELSEQEKKDILNEDDPYENGYIGYDTIEIEIVDGAARLAEPLSFHAGQ